MSYGTKPLERTAAAIMSELKIIAGMPDQTIAIGQLLIEMRALSDGQFDGLLQQLRPDLARPDAWADRAINEYQRSVASGPPVASGEVYTSTSSQEAAGSPAGGECLSRTGAPSVPDERAARLYQRLRPLLALPTAARREPLAEAAAHLGLSRSSVYLALTRLRQSDESAAALNRKPRADRGQVRIPEAPRQFFLRRRLDPITRHESVQLSIDLTRSAFADLDCGDYSFRRLEAQLPRAILMREKIWRATFLPSGQWEVPYPNHTWVFDMTVADLFCWNGDPERKPYRPNLTAVVDEHTGSCLFGLYTEQTPSRAVLQAVLLHAILPQSADWPQCGIPEHLHCDNGKIQGSDWLQAVCETFRVDLQLHTHVEHSAVRSPWQDGHIERFFGIAHDRFETQFPPAYRGRSPEHEPESYRNRGPQDWREYPALERLNADFRRWIVADYHSIRHDRLKMSRLDAWQLSAQGHINLPPDEAYLRHALLQRDQRQVRRGRVHLNTCTYWCERLQAFDGMTLEVRWDPADLDRVILIEPGGQVIEAERERAGRVDNPADIAALKERRRRTRAEREAMQVAAETVAGGTEAERDTFQRYLRDAQQRAPIRFPLAARATQPKSPDLITADEILQLVQPPDSVGQAGNLPDDPEPLELYGIEI